MKEADFLAKLKEEGRLKLVNPSEEVKGSYLGKSKSYLDSAKILLKNKKLEETVSMLYYSMYYSLLALMFGVGIKSENHTASIILAKILFGLDTKKLSYAKKERIDKQYYVDFKITEKEIAELVNNAEEFNASLLDYIEKLTQDKVEQLRKKFKKLLKD